MRLREPSYISQDAVRMYVGLGEGEDAKTLHLVVIHVEQVATVRSMSKIIDLKRSTSRNKHCKV